MDYRQEKERVSQNELITDNKEGSLISEQKVEGLKTVYSVELWQPYELNDMGPSSSELEKFF